MDRRTALITAASVAAVVVTGATAIGANIGILSNASASNVGELAAVTEVATTPPAVIAAPSPVPTSAGQLVTVQGFEADIAGSVSVEFTADELRLGSVSPNPGWTWSSSQAGDDELMVVFLSSDGREFRFVAELLPDGTVAAKVDELLVQTVQGQPQVVTIRRSVTATTQVTVPPVAASATPAPPGGIVGPTTAAARPTPDDDLDDLDEFDDDLDEFEGADDDDLDEFEGADDDDLDEFEGADDDD